MVKKKIKLQGKELASYLKTHKKDFEGNGDDFCLAAGYGIKTRDGNEKCNFPDFIKELALAVEDRV